MGEKSGILKLTKIQLIYIVSCFDLEGLELCCVSCFDLGGVELCLGS